MKRFLICVLMLTLSISFGLAEEYGLPRQYPLSANGEAIIDDVLFQDGYDVNDLNRVFYEIFVGSFSDGDGDGTGDLRGIINRLDYLNDGDPTSGLSLGVEGLWLTPIFASPSYHKYDVSDFYAVDPAFGSENDLKELIDACHARGMLIILDLPINHTGNQNAWFKRFLNAHITQNTESPYYDFYTWIDADAQTPAGRYFAKYPSARLQYEANFSESMPELNFDDPAVRQAVLEVARHYLALGVDGFRFDAAKYIYFGDNKQSVEFWQWYIGELKKEKPDLYTVAEVWDGEGIINQYLASTSCFNFTLSQVNGLIAETAKAGNVNRFTAYIEKYLNRIGKNGGQARSVLFISNHDMDRAAGYLTLASGNMMMAANLYLLSPGSPFIYYGEEIGMRGSRGSASTDANRRLAMLWGDGDSVQDPPGADYDVKNQTPSTVQALYADGSGLYNYYKRLLMIRKANPEIARGEYTALEFPDTKVGGFLCTWQGQTVAVLHNTTGRTIEVELGQTFKGINAVIGLGNASLQGTMLTLEGQTSAVLR